jgi:hypothetical protein
MDRKRKRFLILDFGFWIFDWEEEEEPVRQFKNQQSEFVNRQSREDGSGGHGDGKVAPEREGGLA